MERRRFLMFAVGVVAGAGAIAASAKAAPLPPVLAQPNLVPSHADAVEPAVVSQVEVDHLKPEEVRWGWHRHWHRRWHRRWHRHWGWHRRHWRRHHWHRRWW